MYRLIYRDNDNLFKNIDKDCLYNWKKMMYASAFYQKNKNYIKRNQWGIKQALELWRFCHLGGSRKWGRKFGNVLGRESIKDLGSLAGSKINPWRGEKEKKHLAEKAAKEKTEERLVRQSQKRSQIIIKIDVPFWKVFNQIVKFTSGVTNPPSHFLFFLFLV